MGKSFLPKIKYDNVNLISPYVPRYSTHEKQFRFGLVFSDVSPSPKNPIKESDLRKTGAV